MMNLYRKCALLICFIGLVMAKEALAQTGSTSVNSTAVKPKTYAKDVDFAVEENIRQEDKMYQISVWRRIDLKEKYNQPLYGSGLSAQNGIMRHIRNAVLSTKVKAYSSETLEDSTEISIPKFQVLFDSTDYKGRLRVQDLYLLDFKEDFVFDRHHSQFKFDIKYIALVKPKEFNLTDPTDSNSGGTENTFAYIPYKELMDYFEEEKIQGVWINFKNSAESKSYVEAFNQRMFRSVVTKFTNEFDMTLAELTQKRFDKFSPEDQKKYKEGWPKLQAFLDAMAFEYKLVDFENSVWEW